MGLIPPAPLTPLFSQTSHGRNGSRILPALHTGRSRVARAALPALRLLSHEHVSDCYLSKEVAEIGGLGELRPFVVPRRLFAISFRLAQLVLHRHSPWIDVRRLGLEIWRSNGAPHDKIRLNLGGRNFIPNHHRQRYHRLTSGFRGGNSSVSRVQIGRELHDKARAIAAVGHSRADRLPSMRAAGKYQAD
jgi:hypothetical protein